MSEKLTRDDFNPPLTVETTTEKADNIINSYHSVTAANLTTTHGSEQENDSPTTSSCHATCQPFSSSPHNTHEFSEVIQQVSSLELNSNPSTRSEINHHESINSSIGLPDQTRNNFIDCHPHYDENSNFLNHSTTSTNSINSTTNISSSFNSMTTTETQQHQRTKSTPMEEDEFTQADEEASKIPNEKWALMDNIGFPPPYDSHEKELYEQYMTSSQRKKFLSECKQSWQEYFMTSNNGFYNRVSHNNTLKSLIRKYGIHPIYRKKIWLELNHVDKKMIENQGYYQKMLQVHQNIYNEAEHQIDLDLSRTFPHHPFFRHANSKGREQLKRILIAFSWRSPYISYTQSMNYIVAMLLLHCDEETAFWLFVELVEEILPKNFYNPQLTGVRIDSRALDELIKNRLPKMHAHFQKLKLDCTAFSSGWFMRVFVDIFPIETTMRILDLVFAEGNKILFRTVLSYLKIYESHLLEMDNMGDVLHFINSDPCTMYDHIKLTKNMFLFYRLTRQVCLSLRTKYKELIEKEDEELENRRRMLKK